MSFRTVVIRNRCKLEYSLNYLVCRSEEEKRICLDEISTLIIENQCVCMTTSLLTNLVEKKIKVVFCDEKHNPSSEIVPYFNNFETYSRISEQINYSEEIKNKVWKLIVKKKIKEEYLLLKKIKNSNYKKLELYESEVEDGDTTNREGHAAKVYFNSLFGKDFSRDEPIIENAMLNYGYSIIVSQINRIIKAQGYLTELGIHHKGETNPFNLTYDLFEPFRSLIDSYVVGEKVNNINYKDVFICILKEKVFCDGCSMFLENAISIYVKSILRALKEQNLKVISFVDYEL